VYEKLCTFKFLKHTQMQKTYILTLILITLTTSIFAQLKMDISASYNIPTSTNFNDKFNNGYGVNGEIFYSINNSGLSASLVFGINEFRATKEYEQELEDGNPTIFDYDYQINYYTFPLMLAANYTFFREEKFNLRIGLGGGIQFMELKKKLIGDYVSDTNKENFNEFAIYPNIGISYEIIEGVDVIVKSGYNQTFGEAGISYLDFKIGLQYEI